MAFRKIDLQLIDTDVANIEDPLLVFNYGITGDNAYDVGTIYARGSYDNVGLIWDESADQFAVIVTSEDGSTTGDVSISSYANFRANTITASLTGNVTGDVTGNLTGDVTGDVTGDLTGNVTGNADSATTLTGLTSTITELNYSDGVTSNIQTQLDGKLSTSGGTISSNLAITGNLTVNGTTTTVNSTVVDIADPIITLGSSASDDNKDRGIAFKWNTGSNTKVGFFGFDDSDGKFTFITDGAVTNEVSSGTLGTIKVGGIDMGGDLDMDSNNVLNVDTLRINQSGTGLRMTNVGAFDNDGSDNFRIFASNNLQLKANGDSGGGLSIDATNNDVTIDNDLRVNSGQFYYGGTAVTATAAELNYVDGVTSAIQTQLDTKITATSTDTLENKTLRAPTFEDGSNSPKFIEQRFVNANTMRTAQKFNGGGAGSNSYLVSGEFQPVVTIIPSGNSQNYQVIGRVTVQSGAAIQVLYVNMGMRSNTLPDLSWSATYSEELTGTSTKMVTPYLWTKETTTAGFIFALGVNVSTIYGTITCDIDIIPRDSSQQSNVTVSSNSSEVTAVTTGYTSNDFTRLYTIDQNGVIEYGSSSIRFEGSTDDAFETILTVTDPTADRTITLPNQSGTIALTSDVQANLTRNENSSPYVVTSTDATNNTGSTLAITAATLGFDLSNAVSYNIFINRLHMRSSEVSVNTSNGTITVSADVLEASDEIDAVWIT